MVNGEREIMLKVSYDSNQNNDNTYNLRRNTINPASEWYYKMGSLSEKWLDENTLGWCLS